MGLNQVYFKQHFTAGDTLESYFAALKLKTNRTALENQLLDLYNKANEKGEAFCIEKVKERISQMLRDNKGLIFAGSVVVFLLIAKSKKWI